MTQIYLTMPQPGETITEGKIIRWIAKEGDMIKEGDIVSELETEKALFEFESPFEGRITTLIHHNGDNVPVGEPIAVLEVEDSKAKNYLMMGLGQKGPEVSQTTIIETKKETPVKNKAPLSHSPYIRKMITQHNLSDKQIEDYLEQHQKEKLTKEDIEKLIKPNLDSGLRRNGTDLYQDIPVSPIRERIAQNMLKAVTTIPHAHTNVTIDMTKIVEKRKQTKQNYLVLLWPALKAAIQKHPLVNATYKNDPPTIRTFNKIHLGVSVDTDKGLFVPVLKDAHLEKDFETKWNSLLQKTKDNKLSVDEVTGATFTFNNFGYFGTNVGVQIIPYPQAASLGMGRIEKRPWIVGEGIAIRSVSEWTLAFDHRVMDGRDAARFMETLKELIEQA
ncbi:2-oxo acid dehydrogenase subunit E2 [bacterium]|nr:2-oxo acid dehydrogenase subunit E2 [bacterium]